MIRIFIWILCLFFTASFVYAGEIDDLKQQIEERSEEIKELKEKEGEYKQAESHAHEAADTLEELITDYNRQIREVEDGIYSKQKEISTITLKIKRTELEILAREENISRIHVYISAVLREIYENNEGEIAELMFQYNNFSEFFDQVEYRTSLQSELTDQLDELKRIKQQLKEEKNKLDNEKLDMNVLKTELENQNAVLSNQRTEKKNLLEITKNEAWRYKELRKSVNDKQDMITREIFELEDKLRQAIDKTSIPAPRAGVLNWPAEGKLSQNYGCTQFAKSSKAYPTCFHNGIDIAAPYGTLVKSARKGKIIAVQNAPYAYGKWIAIEHDNGLVTLYAHLSLQSVRVGQEVDWGEIIGNMGSTGYSTGSHIHLTVYAPNTFTTKPSEIAGILPIGATIDPFDYLP